jgi:hypothetical protein
VESVVEALWIQLGAVGLLIIVLGYLALNLYKANREDRKASDVLRQGRVDADMALAQALRDLQRSQEAGFAKLEQDIAVANRFEAVMKALEKER